MKTALFLLGVIPISIPAELLGAKKAPFENPQYLLRGAINGIMESREPANYAEYGLLLKLSRDMARFDKSTSNEILAKAFKIASSTEEQVERLTLLESLALYSSPIDKKLSTEALLLLKIPNEYKTHPYVQLKLIAVELVLRHRQHGTAKNDISADAEDFCREHQTVWKTDVGANSSCAFAEYISLLEPKLGGEIWTRMCPDRAWEQRFEIVEDLIHYAPQLALPELHGLLSSGIDKQAKVRAAVGLYYAGEKEQALSAIACLKPEGLGRGRPLGDLLERIARSDPNEATRLALAAGAGGAPTIVLEAVAATRPTELQRFLKHTNNRYHRSTAQRIAAQSLARMGELELAREFADTIKVLEQRYMALATIGEVSKDRHLLKEVLQEKLEAGSEEDYHGRGMTSVIVSAIRVFGIDEAKKMLLEVAPNLQTGWQDIRIFPVLLVVAEFDPAWALNVFRCWQAQEPLPEWSRAASSFYELLPKLAPVNPPFVEKYLKNHAKDWDSRTLQGIKKRCVEEIAKRSVSEAKDFAERLNIPERTVGDRRLEFLYRVSQIVKAPSQVNQTVEQFELRDPSDKRRLALRAAEIMIGWQEDYFRDITGVVKLAGALNDESLADEVLCNAARLLFQLREKKEAFELLPRIHSPWRRAEALEWMAYLELAPRPRERYSFLQGW